MTPDAQISPVLILGAGGRLGRMLRRVWASKPPRGVTFHYQARSALTGPNTLQWSPEDPAGALPACDTVIALWGRTEGGPEALKINSVLADQGRAIARACGATRLLHFSSAAVYGPAEGASETSETEPAGDYGRSKLDMETRVAGFRDTGLHHCCLRLANVVGADSLARALTAEGAVTLDRFGDGMGPLRSYLGADDLAHILIALARLSAAELPDTLNVAARAPVAMQDLVQAAGKTINWRDAPPDAIQRVTLATTRLTGLLPGLHTVSDAEELIRQWKYHRDEVQ